MRAGYDVIPDFFAGAGELRAAFEAHCAEPDRHTPERHQVWNYWHVQETYCYLRTAPEKILGAALADELYERISAFAFERYGLAETFRPYLSCYVAGCYQALHNDAVGGRLGYVYSITRWDERNFHGGETLILREDGYFGSAAITEPGAVTTFYDLVPARFNQLLVFDDRLPHAVPRIEGLMDPLAGRVVLHGHFRERGVRSIGTLPDEEAAAALAPALEAIRRRGAGFHGLLTARLIVSRHGTVKELTPLLERVLPLSQGARAFDSEPVFDILRGTSFPGSRGDSRITVPIAFSP